MAASWALLQNHFRTILRFAVYTAVEDEAALGVLTNQKVLHRGSLLEGGLQILLRHYCVNRVDIRTYRDGPLPSLEFTPCREEEVAYCFSASAIRKRLCRHRIICFHGPGTGSVPICVE